MPNDDEDERMTELPSETYLEDFVELSVLLTGFPRSQLTEPTYSLHRTYWEKLNREVGPETARSLIDKYRRLVKVRARPERIGEEMLNPPRSMKDSEADKIAKVSRAVLQLWYLGRWHPPDPFKTYVGEVVSPEAYTQGLVWKTIGAPASGTSTSPYGSWAQPPANVEDLNHER